MRVSRRRPLILGPLLVGLVLICSSAGLAAQQSEKLDFFPVTKDLLKGSRVIPVAVEQVRGEDDEGFPGDYFAILRGNGFRYELNGIGSSRIVENSAPGFSVIFRSIEYFGLHLGVSAWSEGNAPLGGLDATYWDPLVEAWTTRLSGIASREGLRESEFKDLSGRNGSEYEAKKERILRLRSSLEQSGMSTAFAEKRLEELENEKNSTEAPKQRESQVTYIAEDGADHTERHLWYKEGSRVFMLVVSGESDLVRKAWPSYRSDFLFMFP